MIVAIPSPLPSARPGSTIAVAISCTDVGLSVAGLVIHCEGVFDARIETVDSNDKIAEGVDTVSLVLGNVLDVIDLLGGVHIVVEVNFKT